MLTVATVIADENGVVTIGNDDCLVELTLEFHPRAYGTSVFRRLPTWPAVSVPVCFVWRYPCLN